MSLVPEQRSGIAIDAKSSIELNNEKIARVFYDIVKNRLQHVNSWSIIAGNLSAEFQLVNKEGIEVYRRAQEGDFLKIDIPGPGNNSGSGFDWVRIEEIENYSNGEGIERFGFRVRPCENPSNKRGDIAHFYSEESTSTFLVQRVGNSVAVTISDRNTKMNVNSEFTADKIRNGLVASAALIRFSRIQWKNLTDGLVSR